VKVLYGAAAATVSRTARVSTVRWDPKEAAGKVPARRTGTASEAVPRLGEFANQNEAPRPQKPGCVYAAGARDEGIHPYPWRPRSVPRRRGKPRRKAWLRGEESAEGIVPALAEAKEVLAVGSEGRPIPLTEAARARISPGAGKARTTRRRRGL
jgi:hypothetical protein